jgi:hypothetical protein
MTTRNKKNDNKSIKAKGTTKDAGNKPKPKPFTVNFEPEHLNVLIKALETYERLRMGQFKIALDEAFDGKLQRETTRVLEHLAQRDPIFNDLPKPNGAYGVGNPATGDACIAYEINKTLRNFRYFQTNDGWVSAFHVDSRGPILLSGVKPPTIEGFTTEKTFPLPKSIQSKAMKAFKLGEGATLWKIIEKGMQLPKGDTYKIMTNPANATELVVVINRPSKPNETN